MGKRDEFLTHMVIVSGQNLEMDKVGVLQTITMNLTYPELQLLAHLWLALSCSIHFAVTIISPIFKGWLAPDAYPSPYVVCDTGTGDHIHLWYNMCTDSFLQCN
jgi:hypothetical protein